MQACITVNVFATTESRKNLWADEYEDSKSTVHSDCRTVTSYEFRRYIDTMIRK